MIKAIIFDFDGTIIDTETAWYVAFRDAYKEHGVDLTLELYSQCIGTSLHSFNPYEYLITHRKLPIDREAFRSSVQLQHSRLMEKENVRPGVMALLEHAKASGLKIGLASSSARDWVEKYLDRLGIRQYFECIRTADDVKHVKPDPELYVQALAGLGVEASEALAIEDSPNGFRAAAAAGMHYVIIPNTITRHLEFDTARFTADSLEDLDFDRLVSDPVGLLNQR